MPTATPTPSEYIADLPGLAWAGPDGAAHLTPATLQRALAAWLVAEGAHGVGAQVATRPQKLRALLAAFWVRRQRPRASEGADARERGPLLVPRRTAIIEYRSTRRACWDCADAEDLLVAWRAARHDCHALEPEIREQEPELRETGELFAELATWAYQRSQNPQYRSARREADRLERALYQGTRFAALQRAAVADALYLATPVAAVLPEEVAAGWGLLWVAPDHTVQEVVPAPAPTTRCTPEARLHLVQQLAAASLGHLLAPRRRA